MRQYFRGNKAPRSDKPLILDPDKVLRRYIVDIILIVTCLIASFVASGLATRTSETASAVINMSGKQRMLSQRILYLSHQMLEMPQPVVTERLSSAVLEFERAHTLLTQSDLANADVRAVYFNRDHGLPLDERVQMLVRLVKASLQDKSYQQNSGAPRDGFRWVETFDSEALLTGLDQAVSAFEENGNAISRGYERLQNITFFLALLVLIFEAVFIFRPALKNIRLAMGKERELAVVQTNFLTKMSHEMRTPLNAIIGFSDTLLHDIYGALTQKQHRVVGDIHGSGSHLLSLVNDLLDLDRVARDEVVVTCERLNLDEIVDYTKRALNSRAQERGIQIKISRQTESAEWINADAIRAKQCLLNIVENAIKFSPDGGSVEIGVARDGEEVMVTVRDEGSGIADEDIPTALSLFGRIRNKDYIAADGFGVGLSLTAHLMDKQGGRLVVTSREGVGAKVSLCFYAA